MHAAAGSVASGSRRATAPRAPRSPSDSAASPWPATRMKPKIVENQCGSSDMIQSIDGEAHEDDVDQQARRADHAEAARVGLGDARPRRDPAPPTTCSAARADRSRRRSRSTARTDEERQVQVRRLDLQDLVGARPRRAAPRRRASAAPNSDRHEEQRARTAAAAAGLEDAPRRPGPTARRTCAAASAARAIPATGRGRTGSRSATTAGTVDGCRNAPIAPSDEPATPTIRPRCCRRADAAGTSVVSACVSMRSVLAPAPAPPPRRPAARASADPPPGTSAAAACWLSCSART